MKDHNHVLYETEDQDAPKQIRDRNGDVCLGLCKVCGAGERELFDYPECPMPRRTIYER